MRNVNRWRAVLASIFLLALCGSQVAVADEAERLVYDRALQLAAAGNDTAALEHLAGALPLLRPQGPWQGRFEAAMGLLEMRRHAALRSQLPDGSPESLLVAGYLQQHPAPQPDSAWAAAVLATLLPGAGHAWLQRWHDAGVAALLVWPMLLLTLWAARRRMGPVTVFFAMLTVWLWSGTVFSALSLAERGNAEAYAVWWSGAWQASGLPGRPW